MTTNLLKLHLALPKFIGQDVAEIQCSWIYGNGAVGLVGWMAMACLAWLSKLRTLVNIGVSFNVLSSRVCRKLNIFLLSI